MYDPPDPRQRVGGAETQHEIVPWEHSAVGRTVTPQPVPVGKAPPKPPIPVQRKTLMTMLTIIVVLLVVAGGLVFMELGSNKAPVAAVVVSTASTSAATTAPTDTVSLSPSPELSASPSDSPSASASDSASVSASDTGSSTGTFGPVFGSQPLGAPVDGDIYTQRDVHISNVDYPNSVAFYCPTSGMTDWNVAGYATFIAVFGIPDDAQSATGITNGVTFSDQNGHQLGTAKASIGQPAQVRIALKGATRLLMTCDRQGSNNSTNNYVALGNASLSTS
ncbi:MAG TPA: hypothetical protein VFU65_11035 [Actinocrinis sp.]|nr:hypothetical protein [Actinocrinis sp.]